MQEVQLDLPIPLETRNNLRPIEGGRAISARNTKTVFDKESFDVSNALENLAGFFMLAWDDEGQISWAYHSSTRSPFSPALLPDIIKERAASAVIGGA